LASVDDVFGEPENTPIHDAIMAGVDVLDQAATVSFTPYVKMILPIDGFVTWVNASLLTPAQLAQYGVQDPTAIEVDGSLHYASIGVQREDETFVIRQMDFTSGEPVPAFETLGPDVLYVGTVNTGLGPFQFTFSKRNSFYRAANIYHYVGDAVYPVFQKLLIDRLEDFDQRQVVSNSLPIWLLLLSGSCPYPSPITVAFPAYPAMLVRENSPPPYVSIEVEETPRLIQEVPLRSRNNSVSQLVVDRVSLITYGLRNQDIMDLRDYVLDYSFVTGVIGIVDAPVVSDVRRGQVELGALAFKKRVNLSVSYHQQAARDVAQQLILHAAFGLTLNSNVTPP
jgi:hypothetical protein